MWIHQDKLHKGKSQVWILCQLGLLKKKNIAILYISHRQEITLRTPI